MDDSSKAHYCTLQHVMDAPSLFVMDVRGEKCADCARTASEISPSMIFLKCDFGCPSGFGIIIVPCQDEKAYLFVI